MFIACHRSLLVEWKTNKVAKVNSYGNFGLDWSYGALSLDAQVGVRVDAPTLKAI